MESKTVSTQWKTDRESDHDRSVLTRVGAISVPTKFRLWVVGEGDGYVVCGEPEGPALSKTFTTQQAAMDQAEITCCEMLSEMLREALQSADSRRRAREMR
jgi:hypothetical protein